MAENESQETEVTETEQIETEAKETTSQGEGSKGAPDAAKAAEKYKAQRDEYQKQAEELKKQLEELKGKGDIDALKAELEKSHADAEEAAKKANRDRLNVSRLAQAGCIDFDVALSLLDEDGDVDALKEAKPYLFGAATGSTGLKPSGAGSETGNWEKAAKASGIPVEKLRK